MGEKERERKRKGRRKGGVNEKERVGIVTIETNRGGLFDLLTNCLTFSIEGCGFFLEIRKSIPLRLKYDGLFIR